MTLVVVNAAPTPTTVSVVDYPTTKDTSERQVCGSWMMKTNENVVFKVGNSVFKPNIEYSTSSLIGENGKLTISNTDEVFRMQDFYNMMNYDDNKFIIWSIDGSFRFYNCIKQDDIKPKLTNETHVVLDNDSALDVRSCMNNVDCINIYCKDMIYVQKTLSCYNILDNNDEKTFGYYIGQNKDW
jgi:hypothetical protein